MANPCPALPDQTHRRRFIVLTTALLAAAALLSFLTLSYGNPLPIGSDGFWTIARLRVKTLVVIMIVTAAHALATVSFQTITHNRILTPSVMGFESLYRLIHTAAVFFLGATGVTALRGVPQFLLQILLMVGLATLLYGWLFGRRHTSLHVTLLIGLVLGGGLGAMATFLQRMLTPSEFDLLTAKLIGSLAQAKDEYIIPAAVLMAVVGVLIVRQARTLDVLSLGREVAINLGVPHRRTTLLILVYTAVAMSVSTALIGPLTFFGFLVAMLAYQLGDTYSHRHLLPLAWLIGYVVMTGAHFVLRHLFYAQGSVGIIIEFFGGGFFLLYLLRKGRLT